MAEKIGSTMRGIYRDILRDAEGHTIEDRGWQSNTILQGFRFLLAGFMMNETAAGITGLVVGQGDPAWDTDGTPAPNAETTTALVDPYNPIVPFSELDVVFLDQDDQVIAGPSSRLQITATLNPAYPSLISPSTNYPLREFGLLARLDNTEILINNIRHPVLHKEETSTLIRIIRLYF